MPDIFLSYNREDQARARLFAEAFAGQGFDVWWDATLKSGEAYDEVTENALRTAKAVVVLWSKKSVVSRWVRAEATLADRNKTLVPCMIEACERPIMFELTQTAELGHWNGDAADRAWNAFLADVRRFVGREAPIAPVPAAVAAPPPAPKGERGDRPSLAVMPFVNRSGVADDDALAFGMVEDVIAAISLSPDIRVLASGSTRQWAGKPADLREVGRDLGVRYVLEGNTRRAGANLRVTVQLVEAETGAILWSQKFDRPLSQLAELQEDLVTEVAGYLGVAVQNLEIERALQKPGDLTAYESVQRAWYLFGQQRPDDVAAGIIQARHAVASAPDYGPAHAMLALGLSLQLRLTGDASLMPEIQQSAERAIALSPRDVNVLSFVSFAFLPIGQPREALRHAQRAIQLNPDNGLAYAALGFAQVQLGLNDEAIASLVDNKRLVPGDFGQPLGAAYRSIAHYQAGRLDKAIEEMELGFALDPRRPLVLWMRAALCALAARQADASEAIRQLRAQGVTSETLPRRTAGILSKDAQNAAAFHAALRKAWDETPV